MRDYMDPTGRFAAIPNLPVPEEVLGAYLEGRLSEAESREVRAQIDADLELTNLELAQNILRRRMAWTRRASARRRHGPFPMGATAARHGQPR